MTRHKRLPQLDGGVFLTDGGLETTLIFHEGVDLPCFAAFDLLRSDEGRSRLLAYYRRYARIAQERGLGFILESATWRASADWGDKLGYDLDALRDANLRSIELCESVRAELAPTGLPVVISGCIGPRGDGYSREVAQTIEEAERYHAQQIGWLAQSAADMVTAITMTYVQEAIGITRAARAAAMPVAISFTVETDGRLPSGQPLTDAIAELDAETDGYAAYCMINCAHPTHFARALDSGLLRERVRGLRANASRRSHAELDEATELDAGNPAELGAEYASLRSALPNLAVLGGCCGTDHRHVEAIAASCA